jgi:sigma-E factor negative regulatory protein RseB
VTVRSVRGGRRLLGLGLPLAWALVALPALADGPSFDAAQWLMRAQQAAAMRSYQGTLVFTAGGAVSSSKVSHFVDGRHRYERIEALDGQARQQMRHDDVVLTLWPQTRLAVFEPPDAVTDFPALPASAQQRALESYDARMVGRERIAGVETDVVMLKPRDALRFAQRLWAERESGLLVRADVLGARGEVLESSAFSDLVLGGKANPDSVIGPMKRLDGYRVVRPGSRTVQLDAEGWTVARPVPGFQLLSCARRSLESTSGKAEDRPVVQAVFTDGLTHVSVFVEPFDAQRHKPMRTSLGATQSQMSRQGDWWFTVVGDVPMSTIQLFEAALQRR